jgi:SAM-dependent methyltransferase
LSQWECNEAVSNIQTSHAIPVDPGNADALRAWNGTDGDFWADHEFVFDQGLQHHEHRLLAAMDVRPDDRVLDIGCGNGQTTLDVAALATSGRVLGVDLSSRMLDRARRRAAEAGRTNVAFLQADVQIHPFPPASLDLAVSRAGAMFFGDPVAAFSNIARALRPGGRLVLLVWQGLERNDWIGELREALAAGRELPLPPPDAPGPFSFADPERVRSVLATAGFADEDVTSVEAPMWFGSTADEAFDFLSTMGLSRFLLEGLDPDAQRRALARLRSSIEKHATAEGVLYPSAAWIVTARRP